MEALKASMAEVKAPRKRSAAKRASAHADVLKRAKQSVSRRGRKSG
jgi:hypothetical protein